MSTILINKKGEHKERICEISINPASHNPVYQKPLDITCPYCKNNVGRTKNFKNLWNLYMHYRLVHKNEPRFRQMILDLANLVMQGIFL